MRILLWHVHGSWTTSFVQGSHEYVVPVVGGRGPDGAGLARTFAWPDTVTELSPQQLRDEHFDVVLLQRPRDIELCTSWLGRVPGRDIPAVWVEHNAPQGRINDLRHPMADRGDVIVVHVTHFNDLFWDCGTTRTAVIEHGIVDPGYRYTGELARAAVVVNEPLRRARVTGTDLLPRFAEAAPLDLFGMKVDGAGRASGIPPHRLTEHDDLPQAVLHGELGRRRVYVHPLRWTSLGLSLLESMHLGLPVVALATTEAIRAVPPEAGVIGTDVEALVTAVRALVNDEARAREMGAAAREFALRAYGLAHFCDDWDTLLGEVAR
ncbi:MAG: hypothetical protein JWM93_1286 [Frankiales bacterium]|nr:hypothetical protein [Frankiales bacterium]